MLEDRATEPKEASRTGGGATLPVPGVRKALKLKIPPLRRFRFRPLQRPLFMLLVKPPEVK